MEFRRSMHDRQLALESSRLEKLILRLSNEWRRATFAGKETALLTDTTLRRPLRQTLARSLPELAVIAYQEVPTDFILQPVALIKLDDLN
jgi:flagellar biosynthesis protein FlhA